MNMFKKAVASMAALAAISALGISASAYNNPDFDFSIGYNSGNWSKVAVKEDSLNTAAVHTREGTVSSTKPLYTTVYSAMVTGNTYRLTTTATLRSNSADGTMTYTAAYAQGGRYYMRGETGAYSLTAEGYWNP